MSSSGRRGQRGIAMVVVMLVATALFLFLAAAFRAQYALHEHNVCRRREVTRRARRVVLREPSSQDAVVPAAPPGE